MRPDPAPVRFLGLHPFRAIPAAILTSRGKIRTRKRPGNWGQRYQPGGPALWIEWGLVTVGLHCIAGGCGHYAQVRLVDFPQDRTWSEIGPRLTCEACGAVGSVNIEPHWHTRSKQWRLRPSSELGSALAHLRKHDLDTAAVELLLSRKRGQLEGLGISGTRKVPDRRSGRRRSSESRREIFRSRTGRMQLRRFRSVRRVLLHDDDEASLISQALATGGKQI